MLKVKHNCFYIALAMVAAASVSAAERPKISNPIELKSGQCVAADEIFEQGEVIQGHANGVAQVCANVQGRGVWLTIDKDSSKFLK
ncbi:hypothetical protein [Pseudomonas sp. MWU12-2323]|uniref:hypothetical protein n=1 Tax=Pseudomonas sp. MWU12-2323 TaxID=2651296 RepID=UPI00128E2821|nr:hypothetical protein [Pseudomonas sp. MWU12-2323]MPQ69313.1 hypothetical protein [Pseudomonas sp. MWU12-2323]